MTKRKLPRFAACMAMMRKHDAAIQEDGFQTLLPHAAHFIEELLSEFALEKHSDGLRCWLLELIGDAKDPRALSVLVEQLHAGDTSLRYWAVEGLRKLDTHEARKALYEAGEPRGRADGDR